MYEPDDCLMISGLQHFRFCRRQWALIHIEQQWAENLRTVEGELMHERAHDEGLRESRGDKRGKPKDDGCDELQLCAQAMCLEEMLCCTIDSGALFYGEPRRRTRVEFTDALRQEVIDDAAEMHELYRRGYTPRVKPTKSCNACSLKELCLPRLSRTGTVAAYLRDNMEDTP